MKEAERTNIRIIEHSKIGSHAQNISPEMPEIFPGTGKTGDNGKLSSWCKIRIY